MSTEHSKCPVCGAEIKYNPTSGNMKCEYCDSEFNPEDIFKENDSDDMNSSQEFILEEHEKTDVSFSDADSSTDETEGTLVTYKCSFCGAEVVTAEDTSATFCVYCHRPLVIDSQLSGEFKPKLLIPFETTKDDAIEAFKKYTKGKWLLPTKFHEEVVVQKIMGVYIPFWLLDCFVYGSIEGEGDKVKRWSTSTHNYKKTDTYRIRRSGELKFNNIPADASKKVDDAIMDSIEPFDFNKIRDFNKGYLNGFLAQKYDLRPEDVKDRFENRARTSFIEKLEGTCGYNGGIRIHSQRFAFKSEEYKYALLPVWLLYTEYKGEFYPFAMNGQSGKFIGNLPIDKTKTVIHGAASSVVGFLLGTFFIFLTGGFF